MIIFNADDFGASSAVNQAVVKAHQAGTLHSASLMVGEDFTQEAVDLARKNPSLKIGLHLTAVDGKSVLPFSEIPLLVDQQRNFPKNPASAWIKYLFNPEAARQLKREITAQFEAFQKTGLKLSHVDGHHHLHIHPKIFNTAVQEGKKQGAQWIRVPKEDLRIWEKTQAQKQFLKNLHGKIYYWLTRGMAEKLKRENFFLFDSVFGILETFSMSKEYVLSLLAMNLNGNYELYFHPGADWNKDLEILLDPDIVKMVTQKANLSEIETKLTS